MSFESDSGRRFGRRGEPDGSSASETLFMLLDEDDKGRLPKDEFCNGGRKLYLQWNADQTDKLTEEELRSGIDETLSSNSS